MCLLSDNLFQLPYFALFLITVRFINLQKSYKSTNIILEEYRYKAVFVKLEPGNRAIA